MILHSFQFILLSNTNLVHLQLSRRSSRITSKEGEATRFFQTIYAELMTLMRYFTLTPVGNPDKVLKDPVKQVKEGK